MSGPTPSTVKLDAYGGSTASWVDENDKDEAEEEASPPVAAGGGVGTAWLSWARPVAVNLAEWGGGADEACRRSRRGRLEAVEEETHVLVRVSVGDDAHDSVEADRWSSVTSSGGGALNSVAWEGIDVAASAAAAAAAADSFSDGTDSDRRLLAEAKRGIKKCRRLSSTRGDGASAVLDGFTSTLSIIHGWAS